MPLAIVLHDNIYAEDGFKYLRGESFEASQDFIDSVMDGDEKAGRAARIATVQKPTPRAPKVLKK